MKNRIVLLGPPASGKGTQAALLAATFGMPNTSTGAMLRAEQAKGSPLGEEAARWTKEGKLFPDDLALRVVWHWINGHDRFILDGFPRTVGQAEAFDQGLAERGLHLDQVYFLDVPDSLVKQRMSTRLTCTSCGAVYNESFHDVSLSTPCPNCGGALARRADDTDTALEQRLLQYRELTLPVVEHYRALNLLTRIDSSPERYEVYMALYRSMVGENPAANAPKPIAEQEAVA